MERKKNKEKERQPGEGHFGIANIKYPNFSDEEKEIPKIKRKSS